jgi:hypothetical protein
MTEKENAANAKVVGAVNKLANAWRSSFRFKLTRKIARRYLETCPTRERALSKRF